MSPIDSEGRVERSPASVGQNPYEAGAETLTINQIEYRISQLTAGKQTPTSWIFEAQTNRKTGEKLFADFFDNSERGVPSEYMVQELTSEHKKGDLPKAEFRWEVGRPTEIVLQNLNTIDEILKVLEAAQAKKVKSGG